MPDGKLRAVSAWDRAILRVALLDSLRKLDPRVTARNPVMVVVAAGAIVTTAGWLADLRPGASAAEPAWFTLSVALWLWFTVLFSNFAEALAEGRGKAQAGRSAASAARPWRGGRRTSMRKLCQRRAFARGTSSSSRPAS
jgi:K+-transporting ATPase ATPase B chain